MWSDYVWQGHSPPSSSTHQRLWQLHPVAVAVASISICISSPRSSSCNLFALVFGWLLRVFGSATMVQSRSSSFSYGLPAAQTQSSGPPSIHPTIQLHSQVLVFSFTLSPSRGPITTIIIIIDGEAEEWMLFSGQDHKFSQRKAARRRRRRCINYVANCCVRISMTKAHKRNALHLWPFAGRGWPWPTTIWEWEWECNVVQVLSLVESVSSIKNVNSKWVEVVLVAVKLSATVFKFSLEKRLWRAFSPDQNPFMPRL